MVLQIFLHSFQFLYCLVLIHIFLNFIFIYFLNWSRVSQASLELSVLIRRALNTWSCCLYFLNGGITQFSAVLGTEPMLGKHSTNWTTFSSPTFNTLNINISQLEIVGESLPDASFVDSPWFMSLQNSHSKESVKNPFHFDCRGFGKAWKGDVSEPVY